MVIKKLASIPLEAAAKVSKRIRDPPGLFYSAEEKGERNRASVLGCRRRDDLRQLPEQIGKQNCTFFGFCAILGAAIALREEVSC